MKNLLIISLSVIALAVSCQKKQIEPKLPDGPSLPPESLSYANYDTSYSSCKKPVRIKIINTSNFSYFDVSLDLGRGFVSLGHILKSKDSSSNFDHCYAYEKFTTIIVQLNQNESISFRANSVECKGLSQNDSTAIDNCTRLLAGKYELQVNIENVENIKKNIKPTLYDKQYDYRIDYKKDSVGLYSIKLIKK